MMEFENRIANQELIEAHKVRLAITEVLKTDEGRRIFSYLFKTLDVLELPDQSLEGNLLYEYLGFLRAGNSIYKLACEADVEITASLMAKIEREKYDRLYERNRIENGYSETTK